MAEINAIKSRLRGVREFGDRLDGFAALSEGLSLVNRDLGMLLDIGGQIQSRWVAPAQSYLDLHSADATAAGLAGALGGVNQSVSNQLRIGLNLRASASESGIAMALGDRAAALGIGTGMAPGLTLSGELEVDLVLALDLGGGLAAESFSVEVTGFTVRGSVAADLNFEASIGAPFNVGSIGVANGRVDLSAVVQGTFQDPAPADGRINLDDLQTRTVDELVDLQASGSLVVDLPLTATLSGPGYAMAGTTRIRIDTPEIFGIENPIVTILHVGSLTAGEQSLSGTFSLTREAMAGPVKVGASGVSASFAAAAVALNLSAGQGRDGFHWHWSGGESVGLGQFKRCRRVNDGSRIDFGTEHNRRSRE